MSREIDERIVSMQFNNQNFEKNVRTTMNSLDNLDKSLQLKGASKGLVEVDRASKKAASSVFDVGHAAETISLKFSALQVIGTTALAHIANKAVVSGERMLKALTLDPVTTGLKEYETQIGAVQTILANTSSKGTSLDQVNAALDELNRYADKTIYNFTEMTRNIGTFTAAGVDLDTSVSAIQGIANLAAVSGSTSQQASTAMYQLSQALASGKVSLMDWNSVVNAGMGGEVFQNALKRTAKAMGKDVDGIIEKYGSFRESLTQGEWLTTDVLTETLKQFTMAAEEGSKEWDEFKKSLMDDGYTSAQAEEILKMANTATDAATKVKTLTQLWDVMKEAAQSGWAQTWEIIVGDFEEAKALWTPLSEFLTGMINDSADRRNSLLGGALDSNWSKLVDKLAEAGYTTDDLKESMVEALGNSNLIDSAIEKHGSLEKAIRSGAISSDLLKKGVSGLKTELVDLSKITKVLGIGDAGEDVKKLQEALSSKGYDLGVWGVDGIFGSATEQALRNFQETQGLTVNGILDAGTLDALRKATTSTNEATEDLIKSTEGLIDAIKDKGGRELLIESFTNIGKALLAFIKPIKEAFREIFPPATSEQVLSLIERFKKFTETLTISSETAEKIKNVFKGVFSVLKIGIDAVKSLTSGFFKIIGSSGGVVDYFLSAASAIGTWVTQLQVGVKESGIFSKVMDTVVSAFDKIVSFVSEIGKSGFSSIPSIFSKIGHAIQTVFSGITSYIGSVFDIILDAFRAGDLEKALELITQGLFANLLLSVKKNFELMVGTIGESVNIFTEIGDLFNTLKGTIGKVAGVFDSLKDTLVEYQKNLKASTLIKIAIAISALAAAAWLLSGIPSDKLANGIGAITLLLAEISVATRYMNASFVKAGSGMTMMIGMATSILIMASALKKLADLDADKMHSGVEAIAGLMLSLTAAMKILSLGQKRMIKGATGIVIFSVAVQILASACKDLSVIDEASLNRGILAIATLMTVLVGSIKVISDGQKHLVKGMSGIVILSAAIKILASVCKELGAMDENALARGLIAVSSMIAVINMFINNAKFSKGAISSSIGIVIIAAAIKILESSVKELATLDVDALNRGLTAVGVLLAALAAYTQLTANTGKSLSSAATIVALAFSLSYISDAVSSLGSLSFETINKGLGAIGGVLLALATATQILPQNKLLQSAAAIVILSYAVTIITAAMLDLQTLTEFDVAEGLVALGGALGILCAAMMYMDKSMKGVLALYVASSALLVLSAAMAIVGSIGFVGIAAGLVSMALSFTTIGIAAKLLNPIALLKLAGAIAALGASFVLFAGGIAAVGAGMAVFIGGLVESITKLQDLSWEEIVIGMLLLVDVFGTLAIAGMLLKPFAATLLSVSLSVAVFALSLAAIAGTITLIGMALSSLALIGEESVSRIVGSLKVLIVGVLGIIPEIMPILGETIKSIIFAIIDILVTSIPALTDGLLTLIVEVLESLSTQVPTIVDFLVTFVIGIIDALAARTPELLDSIGNFIGEIVKWFATKLKSLDPSIFTNLLEGLGAIAAIMLLASAIKSLTIGALAGIAGMALVVGEIGLLIAAFGALAQIPGLQWLIDEGGDLLQSIGTAIGQFVGGIAGGLAEGFTSSLPSIGTNLSDFMNNLRPFIDSVALIPDGFGGKIAALSGGIIALTAADLINSIASFITGGASFAKLGEDLSAFMDNASGFISGASSLNEDMLGGVKALAGVIYILTAAEILDGLTSWITGGSSLAEFGEQLPELGTDLAGFTTNLGTFSTDQVATVECAAAALVALANASSSIPAEGGVWGWLAGENSLSAFSANLPTIGTNLASFVTNLGMFNSDQVATVECAGNAIKALATAAADIPNEGGVWGWLAGENSLATFSSNLPQLGSDLAAFVTNLGTFSTDQVSTVECAGKAVAALAAAAEDIPNEGGLWGWLAGDSSLTEFGDNLAELGTDLSSFVDNLGTFGEDAIATAECAVEVVKALAELSGVDLDDASDDMFIWGDTLDDLALQITGFIDSLNGLSNYSTALTNFSDLVDATKEITNSDSATVLAFSDALIQLGVNGVTSFIGAFDDMSDDVITAGETMIDNFIDGAESKTEDTKTAVATISNTAVLRLLDTYNNFYNAGAYAVEGFCSGIDDNASDAYDSGYALGIQAKSGAEDALDENSPSKEFRKIGDFAGMPFVKALESYVGDSYDAGYDIGDSAKSGLKDTLSRISDFMGSGVDYNPTISPVLNLSNVRAGVKAIGGMLDMGASVGVMANLSAINSTMNHRSQNGANDDVIRAIDRLGTGISNQTGDTYNINGMSYSNNAELEDALKVIMRYMTVEGRV